MKINPVTDYSLKYSKIIYEKEENTDPGYSGEILKKPREDLDLVTLSEQMRRQAPTEGLSIAYDPTAPVVERGNIKITTASLNLQKYYYSKQNAQNGHISDYFFEMDFNALKEQAQMLASGHEYEWGNQESFVFVKGLSEWFGETDEASLAKDYEQLVQEYADSLKAGKAVEIDDLKTTFSLRGEDVSVKQIFQMSDTASKLSQVNNGSGSGTSMYFSFAKRGLIKAAAEKYAEGLSEKLGNAFVDNFTRLVDNNSKLSMQTWKHDGYYTGQALKSFHSFVTQASEFGDKLFSESDLSQSDFSSRLNKFNDYISKNAQAGIEDASYRILTEAFNEVWNAIS